LGSSHSKGFLIGYGTDNISFIGNLFAHNDQRSPRVHGDTGSLFVNNLIYNWGNAAGSYGSDYGPITASIVGNVYIKGTNSKSIPVIIKSEIQEGSQMYVNDNEADERTEDPWSIVSFESFRNIKVNTPPIWLNSLVPLDSREVSEYVLEGGGARPADRDSVDDRIISDVVHQTGKIIDTQDEVGGWPNTPGEIIQQRPLSIPAAPNSDADNDGYTNFEEWLHEFSAAVEGNSPASEVTFVDVHHDHWAYNYIETLYQEGYIAGCSSEPLMYCPDQAMTRSESAVFVIRGTQGANFIPPPPAEEIFLDVPLWEWFAKWVTDLWMSGFTSGCGVYPLVFCPYQQHTRAEGTVFFLRMRYGPEFKPVDPVGIFADVSLDDWHARWMESAYSTGIILPCETEPLLKICPNEPLDRATAAFMMVKAKGIPILSIHNPDHNATYHR
jgi:hypothetical protein